MTIGGEGSGDVLKLSAGEGSLGASSWGARGVCEGDMAKSYFWGPADGGHCRSLCPYYFVQQLAQRSHSPKVVSHP